MTLDVIKYHRRIETILIITVWKWMRMLRSVPEILSDLLLLVPQQYSSGVQGE